MDAHALRDLQRPIKDGYKADPASARIPARAVGHVDVASLTCRLEGPSGPITAGLHPAAGGSGEHECSADLLLQALVACAGVTFAAVATSMDIPIRAATIVAEGHWDARGTLAVDREAPVGMTDITLRMEVDSDADEAALERLLGLTERYCVIAQTLAAPPVATFSLARSTGEGSAG
jgi:uncharacterized OsmC-like protein